MCVTQQCKTRDQIREGKETNEFNTCWPNNVNSEQRVGVNSFVKKL